MLTFVLVMSIVIGLGCLSVPVFISVRGLIDRPRVRGMVHARMQELAATRRAPAKDTGTGAVRW